MHQPRSPAGWHFRNRTGKGNFLARAAQQQPGAQRPAHKQRTGEEKRYREEDHRKHGTTIKALFRQSNRHVPYLLRLLRQRQTVITYPDAA